MAYPEPELLPTVFKWEEYGRNVFLAGSFNRWEKKPMDRSDVGFEVMVELPEGEHQYKFVVDGDWQHNPSKPIRTDSSGNLNNVIIVKKDTMENGIQTIERFLMTTEYNDYFNELEDHNTVKGIAAVIDYMPIKITTRDVVVASLKIVAIMASAAPGYGQVVGKILSVCSVILDRIWKVNQNTHSNIIDDINVEELRSNIRDILARFRVSELFLSTLESHLNNIQESDINNMMSVIDFYLGSEILEELRGKIRNLRKKDEAERLICLTNLYVRIATIRSSMLWRMFSISTMNGSNVSATSDAIGNVIKNENDTHKELLLFFIEPDKETIDLLTLFNPSEQIEVASFVRSLGLQFQQLSDVLQGEFSIKSEKRRDYGIIMSYNFWGTVWGSHSPIGNQNLFKFESVSKEDNIFAIFSIKWPSWYIHMDKEGICRGNNVSSKGIGPRSRWKILRLKNGNFIISPIQWPCKYAHISHITSILTGFKGEPTKSGYLIFERNEN